MHARSLAHSIERYAELCARLDAAFADRASILRAANLDEGGFLHLQAHWTSQLIQPCAADIAARFGAAYSSARRSFSEPARIREESGIRPAPAPCRIHEPPIRPAPHAVDETERTAEVPVFVQRPPVLPFFAAQAPCRRLHRFDTQTGLPLSAPFWIDDPGASDPCKPT